MTNKFKATNMSKLDNPMRRKILPPEQIIQKLAIKEGQVVADVGCGIGYFTIPMGKAVGVQGKVYAIDINPLMLEEARRRIEEEKLTNVDFILSAENSFRINDGSVDMVFTSTVYHELDTPEIFLKECKRVLKDRGILIILDWNKIEEEMGPPIHKRKEIEFVKEDVEKAGFAVNEIDYIGRSFYIISCSSKNVIE
ncbi:MAG: class I SAM-dependent methyltransferase [Bacillota bacterium]